MLHFANPLSPVFAETSVHEMIREIVKFCGPLMSQRQVSLEMDLKAENDVMASDRDLFKQMMLNLIFNVKYHLYY